MNIFILDEDVEKSASYYNDKHTIKIILEIFHMLCLAHTQTDSSIPYKANGFKNHPCSIWVRTSINNYRWACQMALALCKEYTHRYGKIHKTQQHLEWLKNNEPKLSDIPITEFVQAMPDDVKNKNAIIAYRNYYKKYKRHLANWKNREIPSWYIEEIAQGKEQKS